MLPAWQEQRSRAAPRPLGQNFSFSYGPIRVSARRLLDGSSSICWASRSEYVDEVMVGFLPIVARGDQFFSSSSLLVFALSGEASVVSSTFGCRRAEAVFALFRLISTVSGPLHSACDKFAGHIPYGLGLAPSASSVCRLRLRGGFIHPPTHAALTRTQLCPFGRLSSAVPFKVLSHISPFHMVDVHSILRSRAWAWLSRRAPCVHATHPPHCTRNVRPCGLARDRT